MNKRLVPVVLFIAFLLFSGCRDFFLDEPSGSSPEASGLGPGQGVLRISLSGAGVSASLSARTILPQTPAFTRYELALWNSSNTLLESIAFYEDATQIYLLGGSYKAVVLGYMGEALVAYSDHKDVVIPVGGQTGPYLFELKPFDGAVISDSFASDAVAAAIAAGAIDEGYPGFLNFSLGWDGLSQMPAKAELLIETYSNSPAPIPISWIPSELTVGSAPGTILLLDKAAALVKLIGSLSLPPGEYRLTMTVTMEGAASGVSRMDIAHIYGGLTSSGFFFYSGGDLSSSMGLPSGTNFITAFNFTGYSHASSVIGGVPGSDGTRLIMVVLPSSNDAGTPTDLGRLNPQVETASGVVISSPAPSGRPAPLDASPDSDLLYYFGEGNYSGPTSWTAVDKNGNTQQYTLMVTKAASSGHQIVDLVFKDYPSAPVTIDEGTGKISVVLPPGVSLSSVPRPVISIIGEGVTLKDGSPIPPTLNFSSGSQTFTVIADSGESKDYTVSITNAQNNEAVITSFAIDGDPIEKYPLDGIADASAGIEATPDGNGYYNITGALPYGASLTNRKPLIQFKGKTLEPGSDIPQNFNGPVLYTVTAQDGATKKTYRVTLSNKPGNTDTGIFNFVITNVPNAKVVIGRNPRPEDNRIPIVVQVPYGTNEKNLIPEITLASSSSTINPASRAIIPFGNAGNNQEAVYRVTAQVPSITQDYVVVVSQDIQYYYVNGISGRDDWPDIYNGGSESYPFKTLAYAVYKASQHPTINKIFVSGELNNTTERGAWERAADGANGFRSSGGDAGSVFNLIGTGKPITVSGVSNATLRGVSGKRVLSVTGGADIIFENITLTGGNISNGDGGGIYISGNSKVKFSGGTITGNTARSGGGIYVNDDTDDGHYDLTLLNSSVTGNTAAASNISLPAASTRIASIAGGGGIYIGKHALVWLAGGTVSSNITAGSGGGVLINGMAYSSSGAESGTERGDEYGLLMSGGTIANNRSNGGSSPHGGGGVYVARGVFEMMGGQITGNYSQRQGGGVFIWHNARFSASGTSSITNNEGVGSSKAICSRGYTEIMGKAQADKIYIWNNNDTSPDFSRQRDSFILAENARAGGIVLAYDDTPTNPHTRNFIRITASVPGTDPICRIDLEGHLTNYVFATTDISDWVGRKVLEVSTGISNTQALLDRFPLNTFVGKGTLSLSAYKLERNGSTTEIVLRK
jgi:hypothetical protein